MKTTQILSRGAVLAVGGFVCTMFAFGTQITPAGNGLSARSLGVERCRNTQPREPVLFYDSSGSTLLGPSHTQLSIYSDGLVTLSRIDPLESGDGRALVRTISPQAVDSLAASLAAAGAARMCDDPMNVSDMPLTTLTVCSLPGMGDEAHTFSYWAGLTSSAAIVEAILQGFVQAEFGEF